MKMLLNRRSAFTASVVQLYIAPLWRFLSFITLCFDTGRVASSAETTWNSGKLRPCTCVSNVMIPAAMILCIGRFLLFRLWLSFYLFLSVAPSFSFSCLCNMQHFLLELSVIVCSTSEYDSFLSFGLLSRLTFVFSFAIVGSFSWCDACSASIADVWLLSNLYRSSVSPLWAFQSPFFRLFFLLSLWALSFQEFLIFRSIQYSLASLFG